MNKYLPSSPFPMSDFYRTVRLAAEYVMETVQAPDALIASSFLTAMSVACQADVDVELPTEQRTPCALFLATVADSGERKSATDKVVLGPIYAHDQELDTADEQTQLAHAVDMRIWRAGEAAINSLLAKAAKKEEDLTTLTERLRQHMAAEPREPRHFRVLYQNVTERALQEALKGQSRSISILSDEGDMLLKAPAMEKLGIFNKLWDAPSLLRLDRFKKTVKIMDPRLTFSFMIQSRLFIDFIKKKDARDSGFLARFLICWPRSTQGHRQATLDRPSPTNLEKFHGRLNDLLTATRTRHLGGDLSRRLLSLSQDAKELWVRRQNEMEPKLRDGRSLESVRDFASKALENCGRVAGILHHFEGIAGDIISRETLQRAMNIVLFYFNEYIEIFGDSSDMDQDKRDARTLTRYLYSDFWVRKIRSVRRYQVRKNGPIRLERFEAAMDVLLDENVIDLHYDKPYGRKGKYWICLNESYFEQMTL